MTLKSMTGFSRVDGGKGPFVWYWEIRTVNGRGLDIRLRLPSGFESLEQKAREACKENLTRGNCTINLTVRHEAGAGAIRLNEDAFRQVLDAANRASELADAPMPGIDSLLSLKGVMEYTESGPDETVINSAKTAAVKDLHAALDAVVQMRSEEGNHLSQVIAEQIDDIENLTEKIEVVPSRRPDAIKMRLKEQLARLLQESSHLDEQRLHQEAALLAAKVDIQEEVERLKAHVSAARVLLASESPVGRKLEFLTQEFNREANTICSKSNDTQITQAGLELKAAIDQMREQVQNIE